jgi:hypothetical protein
LGRFAQLWRIVTPRTSICAREWWFSGIGTNLDYFRPGAAKHAGLQKRRKQMSVQSSVKRTITAVVVAIAMSTVAVGAAVGPAQAASASHQVAVNA